MVDLFYTITNWNKYSSQALTDREGILPVERKDSGPTRKNDNDTKEMNKNSKKNFNYLFLSR